MLPGLPRCRPCGRHCSGASAPIVAGLAWWAVFIEHNRDKGIGVTVYLGQRKGHASTSDFSPEAVRETVANGVAA